MAITVSFINALHLVNDLLYFNAAVKNYYEVPLGDSVNITLPENYISAINRSTSSEGDLNDRIIVVYRRIQFKNEKFTSSIYLKETT